MKTSHIAEKLRCSFAKQIAVAAWTGFCLIPLAALGKPVAWQESLQVHGESRQKAWNPAINEGIEEFGDLDAWWTSSVRGQLNPNSNPLPVDLQSLLISALQHSTQIKVFSDLPLIRETAITEADAAFDWRAFVDTRWDDQTDPVGNILTTGGAPQYLNHEFYSRGGLRRQNRIGGRFEIGQQIGFQNTNSTFFLPNDQGTARLSLSYTQPLLRGGGYAYNTALVVLAKIDADIANDEFMRQLQSHLLEITRSYWSLYLERGTYLQKQQVYELARVTLKDIEGRRGVDAVENQIARAQAAVAERRADLIRSQTAIQNAQERIIALINDPALKIHDLEMIPQDELVTQQVPVYMDAAVQTAMQSRPEVAQAIKQIRAASTRLGMARNEMLPRLDLILETYTAGLRGESDIPQAWVDQFDIAPSYGVGLNYEIPICNRAARARYQRRNLEVRQLTNQFDTTVETLTLEVRTAVREVDTAWREAQAKYQAMQAARLQLEYIQERWKALPGENRDINLYLEDLLNAQERLGLAEFGFLNAHTTYSLSLMNLRKAQGTLLQDEGVSIGRVCTDCLPMQVLDKPNLGLLSGAEGFHNYFEQPAGGMIEEAPQPDTLLEDGPIIQNLLTQPPATSDAASTPGAFSLDHASSQSAPLIWTSGESIESYLYPAAGTARRDSGQAELYR